jgi:large subunit ribosomal protein L18
MSNAIKVAKKRRRSNKTDYKARLSLLNANSERIVIRRTNRYIIIQVVSSAESQDRIITGVNSRDLIEKGWDKKFAGSLKSLPAAYLTGLLIAQKLDKNKKYIIDLGMARNISGSRIYAAVKGIVDGGIGLKVNDKVFPSEKRLNGEHMDAKLKEIISKIKAKLQ